MKLKYNFAVRDISGIHMAVAVGTDNEHFNGIIKLNESGTFIFNMLSRDITFKEIVSALVEYYGISEKVAEEAAQSCIVKLYENNLLLE